MNKSFKDKAGFRSPAEPFITTKEEPAAAQMGNIPAGYKLVPVEKKTQRVQLVLRPSLVQKAKEHAKASGMSFNELCSKVLEEYLNK